MDDVITYRKGSYDVPGHRKPVVDLHTNSCCAQVGWHLLFPNSDIPYNTYIITLSTHDLL